MAAVPVVFTDWLSRVAALTVAPGQVYRCRYGTQIGSHVDWIRWTARLAKTDRCAISGGCHIVHLLRVKMPVYLRLTRLRKIVPSHIGPQD
jgi:hypothetical protein